ncbi:MAG: cation-transporting P-type ATPase [Cyanobacteria bacterium SID2]|nr:cation-transporting P-type ATPase [Cyanobacteria bacterium SID2]MBP0006508.1 cation-transporting P-type ATPase [Cyanobacteria bacterium SBC]
MVERSNSPWTCSPNDILQKLQVSTEQGLSEQTVQHRHEQYGYNRLEETKRRSNWKIFVEQFESPIIGLLAVAAVLSFAFGDWIEGIAILVAIFVNTAIGFFTEVQAVRSMEALQQLSSTTTKVRRDGQIREIPAEELVPGDIIVLDSGDVITADLRLVKAYSLQANESSLTGESVPVDKSIECLDEKTPLAERINMLYKGTSLTRGSGTGVVVATGTKTELGRIAELTQQASPNEQTPLEERLDQLGRRLIWLTLSIVVLVAASGIFVGKDILLMVETAIALAVAAVPEGLPIVATIALARGMWRMAKQNALINRLSAVETLGATSTICTDKTGTLTENQMTVSCIVLESGSIEIDGTDEIALQYAGRFLQNDRSIDPKQDKLLYTALEVSVLCNNAALQPEASNESRAVGDPMEVALLVAGAKGKLRREQLLEHQPEIREVAFDPDLKMMATVHDIGDRYRFAVKGAPESVLEVCSHQMTASGSRPMSREEAKHWETQSHQLAETGLRVLALAQKIEEDDLDRPYENLTFVGLVGLLDPPRQSVRPAIEECQRAGIRIVMVTGDQALTAHHISIAVGLRSDESARVMLGEALNDIDTLSTQEQKRLMETAIFARVSPEQKLNLVTLHQQSGAVVAMTGDGVNDAPALKKADIGVAMGQRGTQVAKEAADMVLQDDSFATIVAAVEQGRAIFSNIRKFTFYLLSGNVGELLAIGIAALWNAPLPLLPLQILYINFVNDAFPALALGVGEGSDTLMQYPPRNPTEPVLTRSHWLGIVGYGIAIGVVVLGAFGLSLDWLGLNPQQATTVSFMTIGFARLWHVFNMRDRGSGFIHNEISHNPYIWAALALCTVLLIAAVYLPGLSTAMKTVDPGLEGWLLVGVMSLIPWIVGQLTK